MSTLLLEKLKHPDASTDAITLSADGNLTVPNYMFGTGGANFGSTIDTNGIFDTSGITTSGFGVNGLIIDTDQADSNLSSRLILKNSTVAGAAYYSSGGWSFNTGASLGVTSGTPRFTISTTGYVNTPHQPHISGSLTNTTGAGIANSFYVRSSRGGLSWGGDRITVPVAGVYSICFQTISDKDSVRRDANIYVNGSNVVNTLTEDTTTGYHQRSASIDLLLQANDYIQFANQDWYNSTATGYEAWRTASVTLIG